MRCFTPVRLSLLISTLGLIIAGGLQTGRIEAADDGDQELAAKADAVIAKFAAGRKKLKSGKFRYQLGMKTRETLDVPMRHEDVDHFASKTIGIFTFDYENDRVRIDASSNLPEYGGQYARTPLASTVRAKVSTNVMICPPTDHPPHWIDSFDFRVLGANHAIKWDGYDLPSVLETWKKQSVVEVTEMENCIRVKWIVSQDGFGFRRSVWFRTDHDFCPEKISVEVGRVIFDANGKQVGEKWAPVSQTQEMEVQQFRGEWVPKSVVIRDDSQGTTTWRLLNFVWESLNEPIDEKLFQWEGFDLKFVDVVYDARTKPMTTVKEFTREGN